MKASDSESLISFSLFKAVAWPFSLLTLGGAVMLLPQKRDVDGSTQCQWSETVLAWWTIEGCKLKLISLCMQLQYGLSINPHSVLDFLCFSFFNLFLLTFIHRAQTFERHCLGASCDRLLLTEIDDSKQSMAHLWQIDTLTAWNALCRLWFWLLWLWLEFVKCKQLVLINTLHKCSSLFPLRSRSCSSTLPASLTPPNLYQKRHLMSWQESQSALFVKLAQDKGKDILCSGKWKSDSSSF